MMIDRAGMRAALDVMRAALDALAEAQERMRHDRTQLDDLTQFVQAVTAKSDALGVKLAEAERAGHAAFKVLARHGFVEHAGTWISRDEAERISKDGP